MKRFSNFINNSPKQETIQVSVSYRMDVDIPRCGISIQEDTIHQQKRKKLLIRVTTWVDLKIIMLSERIHKHTKYRLYDSIYMKF